MKTFSKQLAALLLLILLSLGLAACGGGEFDTVGGGGAEAWPATLFVKSGSIASDSWGFTGLNPLKLAAPTQAEVLLKERTLLRDAGNVVVSGISATKVSYSSDITTLSPSAQASAPANFVSYVEVSVGIARTALPAYSVTVDAGAVPAGESVTVYSYDSAARRWTAPQAAVVGSTGKVSFEVNQFTLYGIFRG